MKAAEAVRTESGLRYEFMCSECTKAFLSCQEGPNVRACQSCRKQLAMEGAYCIAPPLPANVEPYQQATGNHAVRYRVKR